MSTISTVQPTSGLNAPSTEPDISRTDAWLQSFGQPYTRSVLNAAERLNNSTEDGHDVSEVTNALLTDLASYAVRQPRTRKPTEQQASIFGNIARSYEAFIIKLEEVGSAHPGDTDVLAAKETLSQTMESFKKVANTYGSHLLHEMTLHVFAMTYQFKTDMSKLTDDVKSLLPDKEDVHAEAEREFPQWQYQAEALARKQAYCARSVESTQKEGGREVEELRGQEALQFLTQGWQSCVDHLQALRDDSRLQGSSEAQRSMTDRLDNLLDLATQIPRWASEVSERRLEGRSARGSSS